MQKKTFDIGMTMLIKNFPDKDVDYDMMWDFLSDLGDIEFMAAIKKLVMSTKDINRATNLIAVIRSIAEPENKIAGEAWGEVLGQVKSVGSWGIPKFSDPLIGKAVDCVGWKSICASENIMVERAHFLKIYETLEKRKSMDLISNSPQILSITREVVKTLGAGLVDA